LKLFI
jgi:hypothetical protein